MPDAELIESTPKEALSRLFLEDACVRELVVCILEGLMPVVEYESDKASNKASWLLNNCDVAFSVPLDQKHGDYEIYYVANKTIKAHQQLLFKLPVGVIDNLPVSILPNASAIEFIQKYVDDTSSSGYSESRIRYTLDDSISNDGWTKVTDRVYILDGGLPL